MKRYHGLAHTSPHIVIAEQVASEQMKALGIEDKDARTFVIHCEGKRPGLRVTTIRLTDSMTKTKFIPD